MYEHQVSRWKPIDALMYAKVSSEISTCVCLMAHTDANSKRKTWQKIEISLRKYPTNKSYYP